MICELLIYHDYILTVSLIPKPLYCFNKKSAQILNQIVLTNYLSVAMTWLLLLLAVISNATARNLKNIEHTPLHKRNAQKVLLDVRDTLVHFSGAEFSYDSSVK